MPKIIFLDTNIYLHYKDIDQINWLEIAQTDSVTIIVPAIVIDELNKHKDLHQRPRVRKRAGMVLKNLVNLFKNGNKAEIRDKVIIQHEDRHPTSEFTEFFLDPNFQDDQLMATILMYRKEFPEEEIILVAADMGLNFRAKARRYGITAILLDEVHKLPDEPDPVEEENKKLRQQLQSLQSRTPRLSVTFSNGEKHININVPPPAQLSDNHVQVEVEKIKKQYPKRQRDLPKQNKLESSSLAELFDTTKFYDLGLNTPSLEELHRYNSQLDAFYSDYEAYLKELMQYKALISRTVRLEVIVVNNGTAKADDIDLTLEFPKDMNLELLTDPLSDPSPPEPPRPPRTQLEMITHVASISHPGLRNAFNHEPEFEQGPLIDSYSFMTNIETIKHTSLHTVEPIFLVFGLPDKAQSFHISCYLLTNDLPKMETDTLHVIVN